MDWLLGIVLVLGVMILVHEWGHFIMARLFKVRVDVFSIGFGPRLFGWKRGATDYRVSALPLGGYVRMAGQELSEIDSGKTAPTGAPDELMSKPRWQRALISFAGPAVNLIFPILLLTVFFGIVGIPYSAIMDSPPQVVGFPASAAKEGDANSLKPGDKVLTVNGVPTPNWEDAFRAVRDSASSNSGALKIEAENAGVKRTVEIPVKEPVQIDHILGYLPMRPVIDEISPGSPAARAGLKEGDSVIAIDGQSIQYWQQFVDRVRGSEGKMLTLELKRNGQDVQTQVTPQLGPTDSGENVYQIGILQRDETAYRRASLREIASGAASFTIETTFRTLGVVGKLFSGRVSVRQLQGAVGITHAAGQAVHRGPLAVISLMVLISVNLGILNLLPIPILDGGNILLLAIEGLMRRDLSLAFKERYVQVGLVFLLVLFAIVMYNDVVRLLPIHT